MTVAYDGRGFHGFTPQPNVPTVGGALLEASARVLRAEVGEWSVAGRTDAGVHAWGQVVTVQAPKDVAAGPAADLDAVRRSLNSLLAPRVVVREMAVVDAGFSARHSALSRRYRYTVLNREVPDPFLAATSWHVKEPMDLSALRLACDPLMGEHDFSSFCRVPRGVETFSMVRRVVDARWLVVDHDAGVLRFEIEASSFCQQMVRSVVGTMVAMGTGRRRAGEMASIVRAEDRAAAWGVAPPHGLCLWSVTYPTFTS